MYNLYHGDNSLKFGEVSEHKKEAVENTRETPNLLTVGQVTNHLQYSGQDMEASLSIRFV